MAGMGRVFMNLSFSSFQDAVSQCFLALGHPVMKFVHLLRNASTLKGSVPRGERSYSPLTAPPVPPGICTRPLLFFSLTVSLGTQSTQLSLVLGWRISAAGRGCFAPNLMDPRAFVPFSSFFLMPQREGTLKPLWDIGHTKRGGETHSFCKSSQCQAPTLREGHSPLSGSLNLQWFSLKNKAFTRMKRKSIEFN